MMNSGAPMTGNATFFRTGGRVRSGPVVSIGVRMARPAYSMLLSSRAQPWSDFETFRAQAAHLRDGQGLPRFGAALNLNVHIHALVLDGVFAPDGRGGVSFRAHGRRDDEVGPLLVTIQRRIEALLPRRNVLDGREGCDTPDAWAEDASTLAAGTRASTGSICMRASACPPVRQDRLQLMPDGKAVLERLAATAFPQSHLGRFDVAQFRLRRAGVPALRGSVEAGGVDSGWRGDPAHPAALGPAGRRA
ncbi:MAG: hypothetical protein CK533_02545 [Acidobacterium sp.]|nr:hypothetical protein [Acidobacteriota bacterium]PHY11898.1 MAG: hypothetical protein CK533_02545 [Acidobacterium sp.]